MLEIRILGRDEAEVLSKVADGVFDRWIDREAARDFLADPRMYLAVALDDGVVVGMASAQTYHHPDKPTPVLWIDEVGVADSHHRRGIATRLLDVLFEHARALGCAEAWVLTEPDNDPARRLYAKAGGTPSECVMYSFTLSTGTRP